MHDLLHKLTNEFLTYAGPATQVENELPKSPMILSTYARPAT